MARRTRLPGIRPLRLFVAATLAALPGLASSAPADAAVAAEVAELRAELSRLQARLAQLEARAQPAAAAPAGTAPAITAGPGLDVTSPDEGGRFRIGGRLHYDLYAHDTGQRPATGGTEFRRARANIDGAHAGWNYRLQVELSGGEVDLRDVYLERALGDATLTIGQFKPFRSMDELTSSNDLGVMERGYTSAAGLFVDRQWQQGVALLRPLPAGSLGVSAFSLREDNTDRNEGWGASARGTWAPLADSERVLHVGLWGSVENGAERTPGVDIRAAYAGRRGPSALLFSSDDGSHFEQRSAGLEFAGRLGSLHWQSEWAQATVAGAAGDGRLQAAYLQAGWVFGGSGREYDPGEGVFGDMHDVGDGLWEAVARVDRIRLRHASGVEARRVVLGINYYLNESLRLMLNRVDGEDLSIDDEAGQFAFRVQYVF